MKYFLSILFLFFSKFGMTQDGLYYFTQKGKKDTIVSIYNSSSTERIPIGDSLVTRIKKGLIEDNSIFLLKLKDRTIVEGEVFITESRKNIIYDLYVDKITYPNGKFYITKRFFKNKSN
jgi:hypothetical protein